MKTPKIYFFTLLAFWFGIVAATGQYSVVALGKHEILIHWQQDALFVKEIKADRGKVSSYFQGDSLFIKISELLPATIVNLSVRSETAGQMTEQVIPFITQSNSSGEIEVYFNLPVNPDFQKSDYMPSGTSYNEVQTALKDAIRLAKKTIDLAAYNTNEIFLVNELIDASNRGVRIRIITDDETSNTGWGGGVPFPILKGNLGSGLMHHKFIVLDADSPDHALVVMGSMNFTTNQMRKDPNHLIFIHDQSLARAYTMEFEEMWGGSADVPNLQSGRFGSQKIKNTPKDFVIGDITAELYFSPSDGTTQGILDKLKTSKNELLLALMIFTNWELRDEVKNKTGSGIQTRWIVDDDVSSSGVITALKQKGADVKVHSNPDIFHHKYAIVDEDGTKPVLITGSHNWTFSAETVNDENTIIFHDVRLANIFRQEFEARWNDFISISSEDLSLTTKAPYPNPNYGILYLQNQEDIPLIYNCFGELIQTTLLHPGVYSWEGATGTYLVMLGAKTFRITRM